MTSAAELFEVVEDLRGQPLPGRGDRDGLRIGADHLGGDAARRIAPGTISVVSSQTLGAFFEQWWMDHAIVELKRSTLAAYRCL